MGKCRSSHKYVATGIRHLDNKSQGDKDLAHTMDPIYDSDSTTSRREPSSHTEYFTIDSLIQRVEEMQRRGQLDTIERLTVENSLLQHLIHQYQRQWSATIDLLEKTHQALLSLQKAIEHYVGDGIAAERDWLAFWGITRECTERSRRCPGGWM